MHGVEFARGVPSSLAILAGKGPSPHAAIILLAIGCAICSPALNDLHTTCMIKISLLCSVRGSLPTFAPCSSRSRRRRGIGFVGPLAEEESRYRSNSAGLRCGVCEWSKYVMRFAGLDARCYDHSLTAVLYALANGEMRAWPNHGARFIGADSGADRGRLTRCQFGTSSGAHAAGERGKRRHDNLSAHVGTAHAGSQDHLSPSHGSRYIPAIQV